MKETFRWNPNADQPHNVAPKNERLRHHFKHAGSYFPLLFSNLRKLGPGLRLYRKYRKFQYKEKVRITDPFAVAVSPLGKRNEEVVALLEETGVTKTLVRIANKNINDEILKNIFLDLPLHVIPCNIFCFKGFIRSELSFSC